MSQKVVTRSHTTVTLDSLPHDVQNGDVVKFVSPIGRARGQSIKRPLIVGLLVIALGALAGWPFGVLTLRAGVPLTMFGMLMAVLWGAFMGYTLKDAYDVTR